MNNQTEQSADQQLQQLYQQRKSCHPMPEDIRQHVIDTADNAQSKPNWRRPPVWGATLAACFVILLSVQFFPWSPDSTDNYSTDNYSTAGAPTINYEQAYEVERSVETTSTELPSMQTKRRAPVADMVAATPTPQGALYDEMSPEQIASTPVELEYNKEAITGVQVAEVAQESQVTARQQAENQSKMQQPQRAFSKAASQRAAVSGASMLSPLQQAQSRLPLTVKLLPDTATNGKRMVEDCQQVKHPIEGKWVESIADGLWVTVHFDEHSQIKRVDLVENFKGCHDEQP